MANNDEAMKLMAESIAKINEDLMRYNDNKEDIKAQVIEENTKKAANLDKAIIEDTKNKMAEGADYNLLTARKDFQAGKRQPYPTWDEKTYNDFGEFVISSQTGDIKVANDIHKEYDSKAAGPYTETTTAGGYLLPTGFIPELVRLEYVKSMALQKGRIIPLPPGGGASFVMPSLTTQATANWGTINTAIGDTVNVFGQVTLTPEKMVGLSNTPNELLRDSPMSVAQIITDEWTEAFAVKIDNEFFTGDVDDTTNHKFDGWRAATNVHDTAGDTGDSAAGALTLANLVTVMSLLTTQELAGAEWFFHPSTWAYLRGLTGGSSANDHPYVSVDGPYQYNLLGYPVNTNNEVSLTWASVAADESFVLFGNPAYIYIGMMNDIRVDSSADLYFNKDQTSFRAIQRLAIAVALPGSLSMLTRGPSS